MFFLSMPHELPVQQFSRDDPGVSKNLHISKGTRTQPIST